jgi:hypothetical protein
MYRFGFNHRAGRDIMATIRPPRARSTRPDPARTRSDRQATMTTGQGSCMRTCADAQ